MQILLDSIEKAIADKYSKIRQSGNICSEIRDLERQIRFRNPELACHIKKKDDGYGRKTGRFTIKIKRP